MSSRLFCVYRNPDSNSRPTFVDLVSQLSLPDAKLLSTSSKDDTVIGGSMETGYGLHVDLQNTYHLYM